MLKELGGFLGNIIVILYGLTILNYFVKFINRKYRSELTKNESLFKVFTKLMKFTVKNHKLFGVLTIVFIAFHFFLQFNQYGLNITGAIAAIIMFLQVGVGIYGSKVKRKGRTWLIIHRAITVVLLIAIGIHVL